MRNDRRPRLGAWCTGRAHRVALAPPAVALTAALVLLPGCAADGAGAGRVAASAPGASSAGPAPSTAAPTTTAPTPPAAPTVPAVLRVTLVGDSLTAGTGPADSAQVPGPPSWVPAAVGAPLEVVGGWAYRGATTAQMLAGVLPSPSDVLVLLAGTNDVLQGVALDRSLGDVQAIAATTGAPRVLAVAIPPSASRPAEAAAYNTALQTLAAERGWLFLDPWADVRVDGLWTAGATPDGVHPTPEMAARAGQRIRTALLDGLGG